MTQLAISVKEFGQMFLSSCPPTGWGNTIAVAHSGGADSTCLLYLLHRVVSERQNVKEFPKKLLSLSVDHSLQSGSAAVAESCRRFSESLHIPHATLRIPWARSPFPDVPVAPGPVESVARAARYRVLMDAMKTTDANVIAMGHHADDHVETLLMRLTWDKSGDAIPTSMRKCRRWGMGTNPNGLDWAGITGMYRWVVRPLLGVPKKRILATCKLHGLHYVDDPTNFQPSLTQRNYVRHALSEGILPQTIQDAASPSKNDLHRSLQRLHAIAADLPALSKDTPSSERLYAAANYLEERREKSDEKATKYLRDFTRASPPSTLLLCPPVHASVPESEVRRAIVLRILRFVSPRPWGSPSSEAGRRSSSLDLICNRLWNLSPTLNQPFSAGGNVLWRPVSLRKDGRIRLVVDKQNSGACTGWVASRQPPIRRTGEPSSCVQDISQMIASGHTQEFLWDNRFLLKLRPHLLSPDVLKSCQSPGSVIVQPHGQWLLPEVVWLRKGYSEFLLAGLGLSKEAWHGVGSDWADIKWIRPLDTL